MVYYPFASIIAFTLLGIDFHVFFRNSIPNQRQNFFKPYFYLIRPFRTINNIWIPPVKLLFELSLDILIGFRSGDRGG